LAQKLLAQVRKTGIVDFWLKGEDGYGFIRPDDGGEEVFVHHTGIAAHSEARALSKGVRVTYEVARRKMGGLWAEDVCEVG
jgi:cold shock CspA family protein